jgi:hypothetical protein
VLILGDKEVRFDLMTGTRTKTITRSVELECSRLKRYKLRLIMLRVRYSINLNS